VSLVLRGAVRHFCTGFDLAALVRSAARPGLGQRILDYRAQVAARATTQ
jgi:enoyl-CoA hydratase/carnithine racemase